MTKYGVGVAKNDEKALELLHQVSGADMEWWVVSPRERCKSC